MSTEKSKKNTKKEIVEVAMTLFASKGYHRTTTAAISKEANISTGLLFYHFSSKEKLLHAIIDLILSKIENILNQSPGKSPSEGLENIIDGFFDSLKEDTTSWDLYISLLYQPDTKDLIFDRVYGHSKIFRRTIYGLMKEMGNKNPSMDSFEFEFFRVGIFASYLTNHDEVLLNKAREQMKKKYLLDY